MEKVRGNDLSEKSFTILYILIAVCRLLMMMFVMSQAAGNSEILKLRRMLEDEKCQKAKLEEEIAVLQSQLLQLSFEADEVRAIFISKLLTQYCWRNHWTCVPLLLPWLTTRHEREVQNLEQLLYSRLYPLSLRIAIVKSVCLKSLKYIYMCTQSQRVLWCNDYWVHLLMTSGFQIPLPSCLFFLKNFVRRFKSHVRLIVFSFVLLELSPPMRDDMPCVLSCILIKSFYLFLSLFVWFIL